MNEDGTSTHGFEPDSTPDPDASPFRSPGVAGIPYERGSEEDLAIKRVIREAREARAARSSDGLRQEGPGTAD